MAEILLKHIDMTLDPESVAAAIKTVKDLQEWLGKALAELARYLTEEGGKGIAQMYIAQFPAIDTGYMADHIEGKYDTKTHSGKLTANAEYAVYVEYGTGIVGAANPHPEPEGWQYDVHHHGVAGWWYPSAEGWYQPRDGGPLMAWTMGAPARPFMYNTMLELERIAEQEGGRIIAQYIP